MNSKKLFALLTELDNNGDFDQLNKTLNEYENNPKLVSVISYYRGYMADYGHGMKKDKDTAYSFYQKSYNEGHFPLAAYELSNRYEQAKDIKKANALLLEAADNGCLEAMNDLGVVYISGRGDIHQNVPKALELWKSCIKNNYSLAEINLAYYNINNYAKKNEVSNSFKVLKKYVSENVKEALYYYGLILIDGIKTDKDVPQGIKLIKKAASLSDLKAILFLADALYHGHYVLVDHKASLFYYEKAALMDDLSAMLFCSYAYLKGDGVEKNLQKSLDYCYLAAKGGHTDAQIALGDRYYFGDSVKNDFHVALHWYKLAADNNSAYAYERIADMLIDGQGIKKDTKKAYQFYQKALELGDEDVYLALGKMNEKGIGTKRDKEQAFEYYYKGYQNKNPYAAYNYAELACSGKINGLKDYQSAAPAYEFAATSGMLEANKKAGECYLKGYGVVKDLEKSLDYYLKASLLGDTESTIMVNIIKKQIDLNSI